MRQIPSQRNTFIGGMDKDTAPEFIEPSRYVEAMNMGLYQVESTVVDFQEASTSGKTGKLVTIQGHERWLDLPSIPERPARTFTEFVELVFTDVEDQQSYTQSVTYTFTNVPSSNPFPPLEPSTLTLSRTANPSISITTAGGLPEQVDIINDWVSQLTTLYSTDFTTALTSSPGSGPGFTNYVITLTQIGTSDFYPAGTAVLVGTDPGVPPFIPPSPQPIASGAFAATNISTLGNVTAQVDITSSPGPAINIGSTITTSSYEAAINDLVGRLNVTYAGRLLATYSFVPGSLPNTKTFTLIIDTIGDGQLWTPVVGELLDGLTVTHTSTNTIANKTIPLRPAASDYRVIGWAANAKELVLFTTSPTAQFPSTVSGSENYGQIWLIDISKYEDNPSVDISSLRYYDRTNFSLQYRIQAEYVVETGCVKRVYFTDNYNPPRVLDINEPSFALPSTLDFNPTLFTTKIDYIRFVPGAVPVASYGYAYRYITESGTTTPWITFSNKVFVTRDGSSWNTSTGSFLLQNSSRGVRLQISGADTSFKTIQFAAIQYINDVGPPAQAYIFSETDVQSVVIVDHVSEASPFEPITIQDISIPQVFVSRAKNLVSTQNRMFVSNYCETNFAGHFPTDGITKSHIIKRVIGDTGGFPASTSATNWINQGKYPSTLNSIPLNTPNSGLPNPNYAGEQYTDYRSALTNNQLSGYWRGEKYRFGIAMVYKNGDVGPVDWVGDFVFPEASTEPLSEFGNTLSPQDLHLRLMGLSVSNIDMNQLDTDGVPFRDKVSGFMIVRAQRDPTVLASGFAVSTVYGTDGGGGYAPTNAFSIPGAYGILTLGLGSDRVFVFYSPETDFQASPVGSGALFSIYGVAKYGTDLNPRALFGASPEISDAYKLYQNTYFTPYTASIQSTVFLDTASAGGNLFPQISPSGTACTLGPFSSPTAWRGGRGTFVQTDSPAPAFFASYPNSLPGAFVGLARIVQPKPLQYGGTSEAALASSAYIYCGHYQPVTPTGTIGDTGIYSATVFGGDCQLTVYSRRLIEPAQNPITNAANGRGCAVAIPVESSINPALRFPAPDGTLQIPEEKPLANPLALRTEAFLRNSAWNDQAPIRLYAARQPNACSQCYPTRIIASDIKSPGERIDSYSRLQPNSIRDLELRYGQINDTKVRSDSSASFIHFWQETAFGKVPVNAYNLRVDNTLTTLGTDQLFGQFIYISEEVGTRHKWSVCRGKRSFYWFDAANQRIYRFSDNGLGDITEQGKMVTFLQERTGLVSGLDSPTLLGGIHSIFDHGHQEAVFTLNYNNTIQQYNFDPISFPVVLQSYVRNGIVNTVSLPAAANLSALVSQLNSLGLGTWVNTPLTNIVVAPPVSDSFGLLGNLSFNSGGPISPANTTPATNDSEFTVVWNEVYNGFVSFQSTKPKIYIELDGNRLISESPSSPYDLYRHYANPNRLLFYEDSLLTPPFTLSDIAEAYVIYCVNKDNRASKVPHSFLIDASRIFERIQIISGEYFDISGAINRIRGGWDLLPEDPTGLQALTLLFKPRQGRWFGPAPIGKDLYTNISGWSNDSISIPITSEHFFVKIIAQSVALSEIASVDTGFTISKRNS